MTPFVARSQRHSHSRQTMGRWPAISRPNGSTTLLRLLPPSPALEKAAVDIDVGVTQVVTAVPGADGRQHEFVYHLTAQAAAFGLRSARRSPKHVRFTQSRKTAIAVATGKLSAQEAFVTGKIRMTGDHEKLIAAQPLFSAMEAVFDGRQTANRLCLSYPKCRPIASG